MQNLTKAFISLSSLLLLTACGTTVLQSADSSLVEIKLIAPAENAPKRILNVSFFDVKGCYFDRSFNSEHPRYQGRLLYQENTTNSEIEAIRRIPANKAVTFKASLSKVYTSEKSDICYFQPTSFVTKANKSYEAVFSPYCEILIFEIDNQNPSLLSPVDLSGNFEC